MIRGTCVHPAGVHLYTATSNHLYGVTAVLRGLPAFIRKNSRICWSPYGCTWWWWYQTGTLQYLTATGRRAASCPSACCCQRLAAPPSPN